MGVRDRFYTPQTAKAILSARIVLGIGLAGVLIVAGVVWPVAVTIGGSVYVVTVAAALPSRPKSSRIDPFTVHEPWRQFVQSARRSASQLQQTIGATPEGPIRERLRTVVDKLDHGLEQTWRIAKRGNEIDAAIRRLEPTALRSKLATLQQRSDETAGSGGTSAGDVDKAIASVEVQLETLSRLERQSASTVDKLRLTQTRLDELVVRAAEISVGAGDTDAYEHDVDDLVIELEALRLAIEETRTA